MNQRREMSMRITFIGGGNMTEAIVAGLVQEQIFDPADIIVTDISESRLTYFLTRYDVSTSDDNAYPASISDVVVLAVKPQVFPDVWPEVAESLRPDTLVISIMAGVPSEKIENGNPIRVVRIMPNTSGAMNAAEAIRAAVLGREISKSPFVKLEIHPTPTICCRTRSKPTRPPSSW
jgi:pyrroline-5-carboxylate reductase